MELSRSGRGTCDGASARGDTFGQRAPLDRVFRRLDGREGTCLRTHGKGEGPFRFWIAYLRTIETPAPVGPFARQLSYIRNSTTRFFVLPRQPREVSKIQIIVDRLYRPRRKGASAFHGLFMIQLD